MVASGDPFFLLQDLIPNMDNPWMVHPRDIEQWSQWNLKLHSNQGLPPLLDGTIHLELTLVRIEGGSQRGSNRQSSVPWLALIWPVREGCQYGLQCLESNYCREILVVKVKSYQLVSLIKPFAQRRLHVWISRFSADSSFLTIWPRKEWTQNSKFGIRLEIFLAVCL